MEKNLVKRRFKALLSGFFIMQCGGLAEMLPTAGG